MRNSLLKAQLEGCLIHGKPIREQLLYLVHHELIAMKNPSAIKEWCERTGAFAGVMSASVFYEKTRQLTAGDSTGFSTMAVLGTVGTNAILNAYFNIRAIRDTELLKDPITGRWTMSRKELLLTILGSVLAGSVFALLALKEDLFSKFNFSFQLITYSAQHFFAVRELVQLVSDKLSICDVPVDSDARHIKSILLEQLDAGLSTLNEEFCHAWREGRFHHMLNMLIEDGEYKETYGEISEEQIRDFLLDRHSGFISDLTEQKSAHSRVSRGCTYSAQFIYYLTQAVSIAAQILSNVGYHGGTVRDFFRYFSLAVSWSLASSSMLPVYLLAFILSWRNTSKLADVLVAIVTKPWNEICRDLPYAIKKAPVFSFILGGTSFTFSLFSFFAALELFLENIQPAPPGQPNTFAFLAQGGANLQEVYTILVIFACISFNAFPTRDVTESCAREYLRRIGGRLEKEKLEILTSMERTRERVAQVPVECFTASRTPSSSVEVLDQEEGLPRRNLCTRVMECLSSLFGRSRQPSEFSLNGTLNGAQYHSLSSGHF